MGLGIPRSPSSAVICTSSSPWGRKRGEQKVEGEGGMFVKGEEIEGIRG